jgi:enoyl-CoA hydratase/carnithine racemase
MVLLKLFFQGLYFFYHRPKQQNAMDEKFFLEFKSAFSLLNDDEDVNVVIIWGEGKNFSCGLDLKSINLFSGIFLL